MRGALLFSVLVKCPLPERRLERVSVIEHGFVYKVFERQEKSLPVGEFFHHLTRHSGSGYRSGFFLFFCLD